MNNEFELLVIREIDQLIDNEPLSVHEYRLTRLLLERWQERGLVEMALLIVAMDEWKTKGAKS